MLILRMTTRRWMVAVAVVALGLGLSIQLARWRQLAYLYEIRAERTDGVRAEWTPIAEMSREQWLAECRAIDEKNRKGGDYSWAMPYPDEPAFARRMLNYHALLAKKYHRAATQPWWPVDPDPPPPKP
jgi:hypothetical protein